MDQFVKQETVSLVDKTTRLRSRPVRSAKKNYAVAKSLREHALTSTRHISQELNISCTSLKKILHKNLGLKVYKVQLV